jgi:cyclohexa-1,5-dienecarbonyl-CoA hydratase
MVTLETRGGIAHLILDDPPLNILTRPLLAELRAHLAKASADRAVRVLLLSARGRHFSAGASVEEHLPGVVETMIPEFMETVRALHAFPAPVVVAIQGRCLGGALELALAGDLLVAGESALLGVPEIRLGVFPPAACVQLPRLASPGLAAEMILTGEPVDAATAAREGLVRRVVRDDAVLEEASDLALRLSQLSGAALREAKRALRAGIEGGARPEVVPGGPGSEGPIRGPHPPVPGPGPSAGVGPSGWDAAMAEASRIYLEELMRTADAGEGLRSFMEKREPEWSHR